MSEQELSMSEEDKFFGVRTKIGGVQEEEFSVDPVDEVVDEPSGEMDDEELTGYSKRVQKRINKLRYESHEERRKTQNAEQMRDEAYRVAQQMAEKNREYESLIGRGEEALINQVRERASLSVNQAKEQYRKAYEEGDTDGVVSAQEYLTNSNMNNSLGRSNSNSSSNNNSNNSNSNNSSKLFLDQIQRQRNGRHPILGLWKKDMKR